MLTWPEGLGSAGEQPKGAGGAVERGMEEDVPTRDRRTPPPIPPPAPLPPAVPCRVQESFYDLQLNVKGCSGVKDAFRQYVAVEVLDGSNKYLAEGQGLQAAKKFIQLTALPNVLPGLCPSPSPPVSQW